MNIYFKFNPKFCLFCILICLSLNGISVSASHCKIVEHSELVQIQGERFFARIDKCVLKPSYIVKSEIVTSPDEPQFRNEGRACCCLADGHVHTYSLDNKVILKFRKVTKCTCGACFK